MKEYEMRYLRYWWKRQSVIDPTNTEHNYYEVFYDYKGRRVKIVKYSKDSEILYYHHNYWKGSWLIQTKKYSPENVLKYTQTYHYNKLGLLVKESVLSNDGGFSENVLNHERDIIDSLNQWLSDLIAFPVIEVTGLINFMKGLFINREDADH